MTELKSFRPSQCGSIGRSVVTSTRVLRVRLLVRAHTYVAAPSQVEGVYGRQPIDVYLSLSPLLS